MKEYVSLTTAAMKMGKRQFYNHHSKWLLREKHASQGKSILSYPGHVTLISWIFLKFFPAAGIIEI